MTSEKNPRVTWTTPDAVSSSWTSRRGGFMSVRAARQLWSQHCAPSHIALQDAKECFHAAALKQAEFFSYLIYGSDVRASIDQICAHVRQAL